MSWNSNSPKRIIANLVAALVVASMIVPANPSTAEASVQCSLSAETSVTAASISVTNETRGQTVTASAGKGANDSATIQAYPGDVIAVAMDGNVYPFDEEASFSAHIYSQSQLATIFREDGFGDTTDSQETKNFHFDYLINSASRSLIIYVISSACSGNTQSNSSVLINYHESPPQPAFSCSIPQITATVDPGTDSPFAVKSISENGFTGNVSYKVEIFKSGSTAANAPTVDFSSEPQPVGSTTGGRVITQANTTAGTYNLVAEGKSGSQKASCSAQFVVNQAAPDFNILITPVSPPIVKNPNRVNIGKDAVFQVFAECIGNFNGPINNLKSSTTFIGATTSLDANRLDCGATTYLRVKNTGAIPESQQSTMINTILEAVNVTGEAQI